MSNTFFSAIIICILLLLSTTSSKCINRGSQKDAKKSKKCETITTAAECASNDNCFWSPDDIFAKGVGDGIIEVKYRSDIKFASPAKGKEDKMELTLFEFDKALLNDLKNVTEKEYAHKLSILTMGRDGIAYEMFFDGEYLLSAHKTASEAELKKGRRLLALANVGNVNIAPYNSVGFFCFRTQTTANPPGNCQRVGAGTVIRSHHARHNGHNQWDIYVLTSAHNIYKGNGIWYPSESFKFYPKANTAGDPQQNAGVALIGSDRQWILTAYVGLNAANFWESDLGVVRFRHSAALDISRISHHFAPDIGGGAGTGEQSPWVVYDPFDGNYQMKTQTVEIFCDTFYCQQVTEPSRHGNCGSPIYQTGQARNVYGVLSGGDPNSAIAFTLYHAITYYTKISMVRLYALANQNVVDLTVRKAGNTHYAAAHYVNYGGYYKDYNYDDDDDDDDDNYDDYNNNNYNNNDESKSQYQYGEYYRYNGYYGYDGYGQYIVSDLVIIILTIFVFLLCGLMSMFCAAMLVYVLLDK